MTTKTMKEKATELLQRCEVVVLASVNKEGYPRPVPMSKIATDGISTISSMKSKTATIFVSGNECLFLSTSFFLALLHGGSVPIIVGTMNNYVNFLFEIKTQPGVLLRPKR